MDRYSGTSNEIPEKLPGLVGRIMRQNDGKWFCALNEKFTSVEFCSDGSSSLFRGEFSGAMFLAAGQDCETYDIASEQLKNAITADSSPKVKAIKKAISEIESL